MNLFLTDLFSFLALFSSLLVINSTNPVNSIINLILVFLNSVGLFILLGVDFIGLLYIIVYVGAIAILFLFVVMMLNVKQIYPVQQIYQLKILPLVIIISFLYLITIGFSVDLFKNQGITNLQISTDLNTILIEKTSIELLGQFLYSIPENGYFLLVISLILLVGMIGSILLARFKKDQTVIFNKSFS